MLQSNNCSASLGTCQLCPLGQTLRYQKKQSTVKLRLSLQAYSGNHPGKTCRQHQQPLIRSYREDRCMTFRWAIPSLPSRYEPQQSYRRTIENFLNGELLNLLTRDAIFDETIRLVRTVISELRSLQMTIILSMDCELFCEWRNVTQEGQSPTSSRSSPNSPHPIERSCISRFPRVLDTSSQLLLLPSSGECSETGR